MYGAYLPDQRRSPAPMMISPTYYYKTGKYGPPMGCFQYKTGKYGPPMEFSIIIVYKPINFAHRSFSLRMNRYIIILVDDGGRSDHQKERAPCLLFCLQQRHHLPTSAYLTQPTTTIGNSEVSFMFHSSNKRRRQWLPHPASLPSTTAAPEERN